MIRKGHPFLRQVPPFAPTSGCQLSDYESVPAEHQNPALLRHRDEWADAIAQALVFGSVRQAARFAFDEEMPGAEIVLRCDLLEQEVTLPLLSEWYDLPQPASTAN